MFHKIYLFKFLNFKNYFDLSPSRTLLATLIFDNRPWPPFLLPERRSVVDLVFRKFVCWPQWMLEHPQFTGFLRRSCFSGLELLIPMFLVLFYFLARAKQRILHGISTHLGTNMHMYICKKQLAHQTHVLCAY